MLCCAVLCCAVLCCAVWVNGPLGATGSGAQCGVPGCVAVHLCSLCVNCLSLSPSLSLLRRCSACAWASTPRSWASLWQVGGRVGGWHRDGGGRRISRQPDGMPVLLHQGRQGLAVPVALTCHAPPSLPCLCTAAAAELAVFMVPFRCVRVWCHLGVCVCARVCSELNTGCGD